MICAGDVDFREAIGRFDYSAVVLKVFSEIVAAL